MSKQYDFYKKRETFSKRLGVLVDRLFDGSRRRFASSELFISSFGSTIYAEDGSVGFRSRNRIAGYLKGTEPETIDGLNQLVDGFVKALEGYRITSDDFLNPTKKAERQFKKKIKSVKTMMNKKGEIKSSQNILLPKEDFDYLVSKDRNIPDEKLKSIKKNAKEIILSIIAIFISAMRKSMAHPLFTACSLALIIAAAIILLGKEGHQQTKTDPPDITIPSKPETIKPTDKTKVDPFGKSSSRQNDQSSDLTKPINQKQSRIEKYYDKWEKLENVLELSDFWGVNNIVIDADDNIIVAGNRNEEHYGNTLYVSKYNSKNGQKIWGKYLSIFNSGPGSNLFYNINLDKDNNIYLSGNGRDVTGFFVKLDVNGNEEWHSFVGEEKNGGYLTASDIFVKDYKIYTVFKHTTSSIETTTIPDAKYFSFTPLYYEIFDKTTGVKDWQNVITDFLSLKIIVDSDGDLISVTYNPRNKYYQLSKYDNRGNIIWSKDLYHNQNVLNGPICLYADHEKNIYLVLHSREKTFDDYNNIGNTDAYIFKYTSNGQLLWKQHYGTKYSDNLRYILVTKNNTIYIAGGGIPDNPIDPEDEGDLIVLRLNSEGEFIDKIVEGEKGINERIFDIALDNKEELFILGYSNANTFIAKIK